MVPKVQESPAERKARIAEQEIERLRSVLADRPAGGDEQVPEPVKVALSFIDRFQDKNGPRVHAPPRRSPWDDDAEPIVTNREPTVDELLVMDAACRLAADYFDRNNTKLRRALLTQGKKK